MEVNGRAGGRAPTWGIGAEGHEPEEELVERLHPLQVRLLVRVVLQTLRRIPHCMRRRSCNCGSHAAHICQGLGHNTMMLGDADLAVPTLAS